MTYQVLSRKYRPSMFSELVGQEHVARSLKHAIEREQVAHAYLFSGPRGVGKTSVARIFAQALNCLSSGTFEPCGECSNCQAITKGSSLAVWEIDGASHNSVDNIRELIETFRTSLPQHIRRRVYIIDEVHMLSTAAFNAFLKSLEEPPPDLVIILATTEPHKIPETVISRCQRYDFRLLGLKLVIDRLQEVLQTEGLACDAGTLAMIARLSEGSMRDALSILDRVVSFCSGEIRIDDAAKVLGVVNKEQLFKLSAAIIEQNVDEALQVLHDLNVQGGDTTIILREFVAHWRELFLACFLDAQRLAQHAVNANDVDRLKEQVQQLDRFDVKSLNDLAREEADRALRSYHPWYAFEALVVRMTTRERAADLTKLFSSLTSGVVTNFKSHDVSVPQSDSKAGVAGTAETERTYDWGHLVERIKLMSGGRVLAEQLRRAVVIEFGAGVLTLACDKLGKSYFDRPDNVSKLQKFLGEIYGVQQWRLAFKDAASQVSNAGKSLEQQNQSTAQDHEEAVRLAIEESVSMRNLKEVFPGVTIKRILPDSNL